MLREHQFQLDWLTERGSKKLFLLSGILTVFLLIIISIVDQPLKTEYAPNGIISFELAKNFETAKNIVSSWKGKPELFAAFSLGIDFLFLVAYSIFLYLLIVKIANKIKVRSQALWRFGMFLAYAQFFAALFDATENTFLILFLFGLQNPSFPFFAYVFSTVKFLIALLGIVYILTGVAANLFYGKQENR